MAVKQTSVENVGIERLPVSVAAAMEYSSHYLDCSTASLSDDPSIHPEATKTFIAASSVLRSYFQAETIAMDRMRLAVDLVSDLEREEHSVADIPPMQIGEQLDAAVARAATIKAKILGSGPSYAPPGPKSELGFLISGSARIDGEEHGLSVRVNLAGADKRRLDAVSVSLIEYMNSDQFTEGIDNALALSDSLRELNGEEANYEGAAASEG